MAAIEAIVARACVRSLLVCCKSKERLLMVAIVELSNLANRANIFASAELEEFCKFSWFCKRLASADIARIVSVDWLCKRLAWFCKRLASADIARIVSVDVAAVTFDMSARMMDKSELIVLICHGENGQEICRVALSYEAMIQQKNLLSTATSYREFFKRP